MNSAVKGESGGAALPSAPIAIMGSRDKPGNDEIELASGAPDDQPQRALERALGAQVAVAFVPAPGGQVL